MYIEAKKLEQMTEEALGRSGVPKAHIAVIADTVCYAHRMGKPTHGIGRVPIYVRKIEQGLMDKDTPWTIEKDCGTVVGIDAANGFGQVAGCEAVKIGIGKAREYGTAFVTVKNSNNFGTAGYFAKMAADSGMIGIAMSNAAPAVYSGKGISPLGTNPMSVSFPTGNDREPFIFDMAVTEAARGKIRLALQNGEEIPLGWAVDADGNPTTDPQAAMKGSLLPVGGHKGIGIAMVVDLLAGMLSGSLFAGDAKNLNHPTEQSRCGHAFLVIDPLKLMDEEEYNDRFAYFAGKMHEAGLMLPGEHALRANEGTGDLVYVDDNHMKQMEKLLGKA